MAKRRGTLDDFDQLALGLDLSQPVGESDLSPDGLATLSDADMDRLLATTSNAGNSAAGAKWGITPRLGGGDEWLSEEVSYKLGGRASTRVTRSTPKVDTRTTGCAVPSVLVSPASSSSTAPVRDHRRASSCSSDESTSVAPSAATGRRGTKRRRGSSRQGVDKESDEYRRRRVRNNVAVRKSRDKAKQKQEETTRKVSDLAVENESLTRQLDSVRQELSLLRSIFSNLGVPIQQLVTDALQSGSPGPSQSLSTSLQN